MVRLMLMAVYRNASFPVMITSVRFMPNPKPTTDICNSRLVHRETLFPQGLPAVRPKAIPPTKAIGALT